MWGLKLSEKKKYWTLWLLWTLKDHKEVNEESESVLPVTFLRLRNGKAFGWK